MTERNPAFYRHSERSEESQRWEITDKSEILHYVQNDNVGISFPVTIPFQYALISSIFCICLIFIGCSQQHGFEALNAESPRDAYYKLLKQCSRLDRFSSRPEFQFVSGSGKLRAKGFVDYDAKSGWNIDVRGPLGLRLAHIESEDDKFRIHIPHRGATVEKMGNERLGLAGLEFELPEISMMADLLLPMLVIRESGNWDVEGGSPGHPGSLFLVRNDNDYRDSLSITLEYFPLRVFDYQFWRDRDLIFERSFEYNSVSDLLPVATSIRSGTFKFHITFNIKEFILLPVQEKPPVI